MHTNLPALFWSKVEIPYHNACWEWLGAKTKDGYGVFTVWFEEEQQWKMKPASHVAIYLTRGFWPRRAPKRFCDSRSCCNPKHYRLD